MESQILSFVSPEGISLKTSRAQLEVQTNKPFLCKLTFLICLTKAAYFPFKFRSDDRALSFEIWDTAGQEKYKSIVPFYYRTAQVAIVVYDITNEVITIIIISSINRLNQN